MFYELLAPLIVNCTFSRSITSYLRIDVLSKRRTSGNTAPMLVPEVMYDGAPGPVQLVGKPRSDPHERKVASRALARRVVPNPRSEQ